MAKEYQYKASLERFYRMNDRLKMLKKVFEETSSSKLKEALEQEIKDVKAECERLADLSDQIKKAEQQHWFNSHCPAMQAGLRCRGLQNTHPEDLPYGWSIGL